MAGTNSLDHPSGMVIMQHVDASKTMLCEREVYLAEVRHVGKYEFLLPNEEQESHLNMVIGIGGIGSGILEEARIRLVEKLRFVELPCLESEKKNESFLKLWTGPTFGCFELLAKYIQKSEYKIHFEDIKKTKTVCDEIKEEVFSDNFQICRWLEKKIGCLFDREQDECAAEKELDMAYELKLNREFEELRCPISESPEMECMIDNLVDSFVCLVKADRITETSRICDLVRKNGRMWNGSSWQDVWTHGAGPPDARPRWIAPCHLNSCDIECLENERGFNTQPRWNLLCARIPTVVKTMAAA
ncbi:MAG: hypothetical protein LUG99_09255 [Lachnospiraceae bacterium]|nr:hypothetical protein [Lachnospiraceae bacterium]